MIKEREQVLEKLNIVFQVILTLISFLAAMRIVNALIVPIRFDSVQYKILSFIIVLLWLLLIDQFSLGRLGRLKTYSIG